MDFVLDRFGFKCYGKEELAQVLYKNGCKLNADGVAVCRKCNTPKMWYYDYTDSWFPIACKHELDEDKREKDDTAIERYRANSGIEGRLADASFNNFGITNGNREAYSRSLQYAANIEKIMPKGYGVYYYAGGDIYKGNFANDKSEGYGTYTWAEGGRYVGYWHNDKQHGQGTYYDSNGNISMKGEWQNGKFVE